MRRLQPCSNGSFSILGITSAGAETTIQNGASRNFFWDHLRGCGDYDQRIIRDKRGLGSPPRVRRLLSDARTGSRPLGITSAGAETTSLTNAKKPQYTDHLRGCGDYPLLSNGLDTTLGSPPRVRRLPAAVLIISGGNGITSAGAETTRWRNDD